MALGSANKQQMQPAQYVSPVNADGLFRPGNYSAPNFNGGNFRPQETMALVQNQMQQTTRDNVARQALQDAEPWAVLERMQSVLEKSQPNLERIKYNRAMDMQSLLNNEVNTVNELYSRAYKGDMNAQNQLANFTFRPEILEGASIEQYSALRDQLNKAQLSVANSSIIASSHAVKKDFAEMVQKLTSENNPDSKYVQAVISSAVVTSNAQNRALTLQETEAITAAINGYKAKHPNSKAVDTNIVDQFKEEIKGADRTRLEEMEFGTGRMSIRDASSMIGNISRMLQSNPGMSDDTRTMYEDAGANTLQRSGVSRGPGMAAPMQAAKPGEPSFKDRFDSLLNKMTK
jgi:hypothetical protein